MSNSLQTLCVILMAFILQTSAYNKECYPDNERLVKKIFSYFRTEYPKGTAGLDIEDPYRLSFKLLAPRIVINDAIINGHSELVIEDGYIDVGKLEGQMAISIPLLTIIGTYEYKALITSNRGVLNLTTTDVNASMNISMIIKGGVLQMRDLNQNISIDEVFLDITNLTWLQQILFNTGAIHMFFQPLTELVFIQNKNVIIDETNNFLREISDTLPPLIALPHKNKFYEEIIRLPEDRRILVLFISRVLHFTDFDPVRPPDKTISVIGIAVKLMDIEVTGVSAVTDIKTLKIYYKSKKIILKLAMIFPHILVRYNATFSRFFLEIKSKPRKINLHNLETNVTMIIDPSQAKSIQKLEFNGKADWIGNIERYNSESSVRKFLNRIEKFMQTHFLKIFIKIVQPEIENSLKEINLEEEILSFIRNI